MAPALAIARCRSASIREKCLCDTCTDAPPPVRGKLTTGGGPLLPGVAAGVFAAYALSSSSSQGLGEGSGRRVTTLFAVGGGALRGPALRGVARDGAGDRARVERGPDEASRVMPVPYMLCDAEKRGRERRKRKRRRKKMGRKGEEGKDG